MIIDEDGEVSDITEEDFKRAIRNPYAPKMRRVSTVLVDEGLLNRIKELAKEKGVYHGELITKVLKDYIVQVDELK